jgi:tetratricopeptide (TPR) repeat protein
LRERRSKSKDLNLFLSDWPEDDGTMRARKLTAGGQEFIQLRVELGLLQMHLDARPDGERPGGFDSALDMLRDRVERTGCEKITEEQRSLLLRELLQFYRRRVSLMALAKAAQARDDADEADSCYRRAIRDGDHNLAILDLLREDLGEFEFDEPEHDRPFTLMHLAICHAERSLLVHDPDEAIEHLKAGVAAIRICVQEVEESEEQEEALDVEPFVHELRRFERHIRRRYGRRRTLLEQLHDAVAAEDFEKAARLRDALQQRSAKNRHT